MRIEYFGVSLRILEIQEILWKGEISIHMAKKSVCQYTWCIYTNPWIWLFKAILSKLMPITSLGDGGTWQNNKLHCRVSVLLNSLSAMLSRHFSQVWWKYRWQEKTQYLPRVQPCAGFHIVSSSFFLWRTNLELQPTSLYWLIL